MDENTEILAKSILFKGVAKADIARAAFFLNPVIKNYEKGGIILLAGNRVEDIGIILGGRVHIIKEDINGGRAIIAELGPGDIFAEALACARVEHSPVTVLAQSAARIMFINFDRIVSARGGQTEAANVLIKNLMMLIARKNVFLNSKLEHTGKRSIRDRLLSYFNELAIEAGSNQFKLPFSKTDLADYLFLERSSMSRELSNMRAEGIIDFKGNAFIIKKGKRK